MLRKTFITLSLAFLISAPAFGAQMSAEEQEKAKAVFELTDSDKDQNISKAEWDEASKAMYDIIDADGNGKISRDEYMNSPEAMRAKFEEGGKAKK